MYFVHFLVSCMMKSQSFQHGVVEQLDIHTQMRGWGVEKRTKNLELILLLNTTHYYN